MKRLRILPGAHQRPSRAAQSFRPYCSRPIPCWAVAEVLAWYRCSRPAESAARCVIGIPKARCSGGSPSIAAVSKRRRTRFIRTVGAQLDLDFSVLALLLADLHIAHLGLFGEGCRAWISARSGRRRCVVDPRILAISLTPPAPGGSLRPVQGRNGSGEVQRPAWVEAIRIQALPSASIPALRRSDSRMQAGRRAASWFPQAGARCCTVAPGADLPSDRVACCAGSVVPTPFNS